MLFGIHDPQPDIHDERSVADALTGAYGVVNAVSLYLERGPLHRGHVLRFENEKLSAILETAGP